LETKNIKIKSSGDYKKVILTGRKNFNCIQHLSGDSSTKSSLTIKNCQMASFSQDSSPVYENVLFFEKRIHKIHTCS
jgi:hypothetical protein